MISLGTRARRFGFHLWDRFRGASVHPHVQGLEQAQRMAPEALRRWQQERLYALLRHARQTTGHYRRLLPPRFSAPDSFKVLERLPLLTKQRIKANPKAHLSGAFPAAALHRGTTSGSTGSPLTFFMDAGRRARVQAEVIYFGRWAGYELGMRFLYLTADATSRLRSWLKNEIALDPTYLTAVWFRALERALRCSGAQILISHPSPLMPFLSRCLSQGISFQRMPLKSVICLGEPLTPQVRALIERVLHCPVFCRYSAREVGIMAGECERGRYHANVGSLYLEYLDLKTDKPARAGTPARLAVTDLFNYGMPLIRYDVGDVVVPASESCACGRTSPCIQEVRGRVVEIITTPQGDPVDPLQLCDALRDTPGVQHFQFIQLSQGRYRLCIVPDPDHDQPNAPHIAQRFQNLLGSNAVIEIQRVSQIEPLPSGKRPLILRQRQGTL